ncbi:MAG: bifunctional biotin--[acetyl-CoA-carboxylase] ligase/biotin operon repressor BirA [Gammaproteobacteria bacterium]|nr:bifunctional biotin--[acetyl-CoA-carboxylase] ligase/biotin operon repressor BirA [Gammaproteobacteria bacterium]
MRLRLLSILSDGSFHSGEALGEALGISRAAVWKHLKILTQCWGVHFYAVPGKGYRLENPIELLDQKRIMVGVCPDLRLFLSSVEIHSEIDSTNSYLMLQVQQESIESGSVCLAEFQSAGRGRRGRQWISPFASNLYLSLYWQFSLSPVQLGGLSLAIAVAVADALRSVGLKGISVKWPNDILWKERKLAGILLEVTGEVVGVSDVVIGVGLNIRMPEHSADEIDQAWVDLETALGKTVSRNQLASILLEKLIETVLLYQSSGLSSFLERWRSMDMMNGSAAVLNIYDKNIYGISRGVDETGALVFESEGKTGFYQSGEVSLRTC